MMPRATTQSAITLTLCLAAVVVARTAPPPAQAKLLAFNAQAKALLARMTLDEKIGQMTQPDQLFLKEASDVEKYSFGSVLSGGDSDPKTKPSEDWTEMYDSYQAHALKSRLKIPLLYGVDAVHGHNNVIGAVIFPHNIGLGATRDAALVEKIARITAEEVRATGINWAFAPCVTVPQDERWGRTYEGFSEDPAVVAALGAAAVRGLQGSDSTSPAACWPAPSTTWATAAQPLGPACRRPQRRPLPARSGRHAVSEATLRKIHMQGYITTIARRRGIDHAVVQQLERREVSANKHLLTDILKNELGFEGFLISDYNALDEIARRLLRRRSTFDQRGHGHGDGARTVPEFFNTLKELVQEGKVPMSRIDDAVHRILRVKFAMGLMDPGNELQRSDAVPQKTFGSARIARSARQAVRESLVLLKNETTRCRSPRTASDIHVAGRARTTSATSAAAGPSAGRARAARVTVGTTILAGIQQLAGNNTTGDVLGGRQRGCRAPMWRSSSSARRPTRKASGDRARPRALRNDMATIANVKTAGVPVVVVLLSGRPIDPGRALAQADALVAAWLPGTEGAASRTCCSATTSPREAAGVSGRRRRPDPDQRRATPATTRCSRSDLA